MGLKISVSTFPHSEELRNELLWAIAEDKSINVCKKAISQIYGKKCLVDVVVCVQPPASYNTGSDAENAAGRNTIQRSLRFSHSPLETAGLERAGACSLPDFPSTLINTTLVQSSHIPVGSFLAPRLPSAPAEATARQFIQQQPWSLSWSAASSAKSSWLDWAVILRLAASGNGGLVADEGAQS